MLKLVHTTSPMPISYPVDPTSEFQPGMIAQLKVIGGDIIAGVSDGTAPFGIIDDVRTAAFTKAQTDEIVIINIGAAGTTTDPNGKLVNISEATGALKHPHINRNSFTSTVTVVLNDVNGVITVPAGTELNFDSDEDGINDSFRVIVSYNYKVTTIPGEDTTLGSGRMTIHYQRGIYATDQYDPLPIYPLNANLYVGLDGLLTSEQPTANHPAIAFVTAPPSSINSTLEFCWI